jgi:hypothetical protein
MSSSHQSPLFSRTGRAAALGSLFVALSLLHGCAVVTVAGAAASVAATGVGLAVDAGVGAVRITGKAVGAMLPGDQ